MLDFLQTIHYNQPCCLSKVNMGEFPSGQRGQTVNLLSVTSVVRIHLPPPNSASKDAEFCFILSTFRTILCVFIKAAPTHARQFSGASRFCFLFFPLLLTACRGQSRLACCLSLRDIDANPDANVDGTKRACLDRMRHNGDTRLLFSLQPGVILCGFQRSCILGMTLPTIRAASCCIRLVECV